MTTIAIASCLGSTAQIVETDSIFTLDYSREPLITTKIMASARAYGDSIYLRWVPEDYASWYYLYNTGITIYRQEVDAAVWHIDTLAHRLKPLSEEGFRLKYPADDDNAKVAMGVLYGDGRLQVGQTKDQPGSMGANMEFNTEQDVSFAFAMLVADWRRDLAQDMAVGFMDRTAKRGVAYEYYIQPTIWDNGGALIFEPGVIDYIMNEPYSPEPYTPTITDTIGAPRWHTMGWWDKDHSSFEIDRRAVSGNKDTDSGWERLNEKPYVSMIELPMGDDYCAYSDSVPQFGVYEYRIMGHDAFGELTPPSAPLRVNVYDNEAPKAPQIKNIFVEYPDNDLRGRVNAHIVWTKDTLEADLVGYTLEYMSNRKTSGRWVMLTDNLIAPTDTLFSHEVTGLETGFVSIVAFDNSGNYSRSLVQLIELTDYKAPDAPTDFKATVFPVNVDSISDASEAWGYVALTWNNNPEDDDISYFDVAFANDSLHTYQIRNNGGIHENMFLDSLALDVNQKYIYYKVRAVDYSTNIGPWSPWIQVTRPHITPPTQPHLDRSGHNDLEGMHMEWIVGTDADMDYHVAYRGLSPDGPWDVIGRYDHDSLTTKNYTIVIDDNPPYDRERRYYYYVESFNSSPFTSKSLAVSWLHAGPKVWKAKIELAGDYDERTNETKLAWTTGKLPFDAPYYYCIHRRGPGEDKFRFVVSVPSDKLEYADKQLGKGEQAEYFVMIQWRDGRQSTQSNTVSIRRGE